VIVTGPAVRPDDVALTTIEPGAPVDHGESTTAVRVAWGPRH
jgi:hypothetical protein